MYNTYSSIGSYIGQTAIAPQNLRLTDLKWEKTSAWNLGFNLNMLEDLLQFDLNVYQRPLDAECKYSFFCRFQHSRMG